MTTKGAVKAASWELRRLALADWRRYRAIRLRALRDAPQAFGSTAAEAGRLPATEWRRRLAGRTTFIVISGRRAVALASGIQAEVPGDAELVSMWVDRAWRGRGVGTALVEAVAQWATQAGYRRLRLWVAQGNHAAEQLYARQGFVRSGEVQPMGHDGGDRLEFAMVRALEDTRESLSG